MLRPQPKHPSPGGLLAITLLVLLGCGAPSSGAGSSAQGDRASDAQPKRLLVGMLGERKGWAPWHSSAGTAFTQSLFLVNRTLSISDNTGKVQPVLAVSIPSVERGDWKINADATMEQTWRIRPDARWQDGHPVTADDFVFGWEILAERELPAGGQSPARSVVRGASAPDPQTFVISFVGTTPLAATAMFDPYPRHILGDIFAAAQWERFLNHEYWITEYIGAGPYRITGWDPGTSQEFSAFDGYTEGKPRISKIIFRIFGDVNALVANILSGEVDSALPDGLSVTAASDLQRSWAAPGTGNSVVIYMDGRYSRVEFQNRPEYAVPRAARDPRVRRAFYHAIDKEALHEVEMVGLGRLADSWIPPDDPRWAQFRDVIPPWSYDLALAGRILEDAGWRKGSDGILVSSATGERMETEIQTALSARGQAMAILSNGWREVGAAVVENPLSPTLAIDREYRAKLPFAGLITHYTDLQYEYQHYACERGSSPENRWSGAHYGYCNATVNPLILRLQVTINQAERTALQREIIRLMLMEDMAVLPMYWFVTVLVHAKGVTGLGVLEPGDFRTQPPWNSHLWDKT